MDEQPLFVRIRGRVLGPYDHEKLKGLAQRGQFSRLHEVSTDGVSWVRAATFPQLFTAGTAAPVSDGHAPAAPEPTEPDSINVAPEVPRGRSSERSQWYYTRGGAQCGPVPFAELQALAFSGQLAATEQVWNDSMPDWVPANQVSGLAFPSAPGVAGPFQGQRSPVSDSAATAARDSVSPEVIAAFSGARPWISFTAIVGMVYAGLTIVGAILTFAGASQNRLAAPVAIAVGVFQLIFAGVCITGSLMLWRHAAHTRELSYTSSTSALRSVAESHRVFWQFFGIVLIVLLAFLLFGMVVALSAATAGASAIGDV